MCGTPLDLGELPMEIGHHDIDLGELPMEIIDCGRAPAEIKDCEGASVEEEERVSTEYEDFLGFTDTDSIVSQKKVAGKQTEGQTESKFSIESPNIINLNYNVIDDEGPSTLASAARRRVVPDIEALQEVVRKLTPRDKIVHLHFDEMYTDHRSAYCRSEDRPYGCGYMLLNKIPETEEYRTILLFAVHSLLTAINMILSACPFTRY
uniref:Uncharacterized protein n=1 Tax=Glossina palpalis gambiensis TaxID=67801 RepID=A0A1B0C6U3_9MUSC